MQRVLSTVAVFGLLIATAAAFAITERLKLVKSPVYGTQVAKVLSPTCACSHRAARISFKLRQGDQVTLSILDGDRKLVRTLAFDRSLPRGRSVFSWDGRTDRGVDARDGIYRVEIHLARQHRTILFPNRLRLDTRPPEVLKASANIHTVSPDGDGRADYVRISYALDSPGRVRVYLGSTLVIRGRFRKQDGSVLWFPRIDGHAPRAGLYTLYVGAADDAGNETPAARRWPIVLRIRYVELARTRIVLAKPNVRFGVRVDTDAAAYAWRLDGRSGVSTAPLLALRAPKRPGRYTLTVSEHFHSARAVVIVRRRR